VRFEKHDLFSARLARERWDLVVSNPPYLDFRRDKIAADVKKWEPRMALEPAAGARPARKATRGAWCGESILAGCAAAAVRFTAMELSPRVAESLERRWQKHPRAQRVWRESDLAGRKRFLLVAWKNA
jgi:methylase of polypeptide subunit release factors